MGDRRGHLALNEVRDGKLSRCNEWEIRTNGFSLKRRWGDMQKSPVPPAISVVNMLY